MSLPDGLLAELSLLQFSSPATGDDSPRDDDTPDNSAAYEVAVYNVCTWERQREWVYVRGSASR
jgi:hypothetical protein